MIETFKKQITAIYDATVEQQKGKALDKITKECNKKAEDRIKEEIKTLEEEKKAAGEEWSFTEKNKVEGELKKKYSAEEQEKRKDEMENIDLSSDMALRQYKMMMDTIVSFVEKEATQNSDFCDALSYEWKSAERCLKFINSSARKLACGPMLFVPDDTVYDWIRNYYALDDKAEVEKEIAEAEARAKAEEERKKAEAEKKAKKEADEAIKKKAEELAKAELESLDEDLSEADSKKKLEELKKDHLKKLRAEARKKAKAEEKAKAKEMAEKSKPSPVTEEAPKDNTPTLNCKPLMACDMEGGESFKPMITFEDIFGLRAMAERMGQ